VSCPFHPRAIASSGSFYFPRRVTKVRSKTAHRENPRGVPETGSDADGGGRPRAASSEESLRCIQERGAGWYTRQISPRNLKIFKVNDLDVQGSAGRLQLVTFAAIRGRRLQSRGCIGPARLRGAVRDRLILPPLVTFARERISPSVSTSAVRTWRESISLEDRRPEGRCMEVFYHRRPVPSRNLLRR